MPDPSWRELNRAMWNERVPLHLNSSLYDVPGFRAGALSLRDHEIKDLGDVMGKDLVHLQCHFGKDTLSWARLGARVTGLDFSEAAIAAAAQLAAEIGVDARFVTSDVYDASAALGRQTFDFVYTGVGALCWLPDMERWAKVVFELLRPGGQLYLFEFHPLKWIFNLNAERLEIKDNYFTPPQGFREEGVTYADATAPATPTPTIQWNHPLGEVVTALTSAGLRILSLRELDCDVLRQWPMMVRGEDRMYRMPHDMASLPLMYVLRAIRDA
ncbi:MAG: class I SAM-dependent methyltransferase [Hyphomicrobiales bacterium]|jgi:SAM-dependent methyltransferase|nr:class I SAM-dependent methyltransferase [Hyphomicrobiales bacterium]